MLEQQWVQSGIVRAAFDTKFSNIFCEEEMMKTVARMLVLSASLVYLPFASSQPKPPPPMTTVCKFDEAQQASDCKDKILADLQYQLSSFSAQLATFNIMVTVPKYWMNEPIGQPYTFSGSGFLVNRELGFFITSKHVLLGDVVWDLSVLKRNDFADFESAMEDLLSSEPVKITARPFFYDPDKGISVRLVAFDRSTDLVLLQALNISQLNFFNQSSFQAIRLAQQAVCMPNMQVVAVGYPSTNKNARAEFSKWAPVTDCTMTPQTASTGGRRFRFPLLSTEPIFAAGMSGGPVFNRSFELVGVVAGGTAEGKNSFFVPVSAVKSFLEKFGALPN